MVDGPDLRAQKNINDKNCIKLMSSLMQSMQIKYLKSISITIAITVWGKESIKAYSYKLPLNALKFFSITRGN
jgi:hypothetical protein